jgi:hypothetical protein
VIAKDESYGAKLDAAGDVFVEGHARRTLARRIAWLWPAHGTFVASRARVDTGR